MYRWLFPIVLGFIVLASPQQAGAKRSKGSSKSYKSSFSKSGSVSVKGYYRKDGTYVQPHKRSAPDGNFDNNWSTKGNVNPYTGKPGTLTKPPSKKETTSPA